MAAHSLILGPLVVASRTAPLYRRFSTEMAASVHGRHKPTRLTIHEHTHSPASVSPEFSHNTPTGYKQMAYRTLLSDVHQEESDNNDGSKEKG